MKNVAGKNCKWKGTKLSPSALSLQFLSSLMIHANNKCVSMYLEWSNYKAKPREMCFFLSCNIVHFRSLQEHLVGIGCQVAASISPRRSINNRTWLCEANTVGPPVMARSVQKIAGVHTAERAKRTLDAFSPLSAFPRSHSIQHCCLFICLFDTI